VNSPPGKAKKRDRSDTASSTRTGTITRRSVDTISSSTPRRVPSPQAEQKNPGPVDSQVESSADEGTVSGPAQSLRKIASGASLSALSPSAATTPSIPAVTPPIGSITDDSDTDFQSAYSTSPRDSYVSFDGRQTPHYHDSDDSTDSTGDYGKHVASPLTKSPIRERVSSTATAILHTQPSLTPSDDTIVSKGRALTRLQSTA
jgi:EEF1A N-terminal glycine/lysine methyltransferase